MSISRRSFIKLIGALGLLGIGLGTNKSPQQQTNNPISKHIYPGESFLLPNNPSEKQKINIICAGDWESHNSSIKTLNEKILGSKEDLILDFNMNFTLEYSGSTSGWIIV